MKSLVTETARTSRILAAGILILIAVLPQNSRGQTFQENALIANYLTGFAEFTHWEKEIDDVLTVGVMGSPGVLRELQTLKPAQSDKYRLVTSIEILPDEPFDDVDILYISSEYTQRWPEIIENAKATGTVTVSSGQNFLRAGGLIQLVTSKNRLRFAINDNGASEYQIRFSSKLIQLGVSADSEGLSR